MKRSDDSEREKRRKRRRLLQELGEQKIPFLSPSDPGFQQLWDTSYSGLMLRRSGSLPPGLDERVQSALRTLRDRGCLLRDLVRVRERDVFTTVSRALVGQAGCTYRYLDTRLFTIPWHCEEDEGLGREEGHGDKPCCDAGLRAACKALWELNQFFCLDVQQHQNTRGSKRKRSEAEEEEESKEKAGSEGCSEDRTCEAGEEKKTGEDSDSGQGCSRSSPPATKSGPIQFNITLINYMDPACMSQLKEEPYYGMGKMAVGWHHDENLVPLSPVAVTVTAAREKPRLKVRGGKDQCVTESCGFRCCTFSREALQRQLDRIATRRMCRRFFQRAPLGLDRSAAKPPEEKERPTPNEGEKGDDEGANREEKEEAGDEGTSKEEGEKKKECWRVGLKVAWDIHTPGLALPLQSGDCYYMTDDLNRTHQHCVLAGETARFSSTHRVAQCVTGTVEYIQKRCSDALENLHTDPETGAKSLRSLLLSNLQHTEDIHNETQLLLAVVEDESNVQENRQEMAETLLNALSDRQQHRQTWRDRCQSSLAQSLPPEEAPVDRPYWTGDDLDMPLPFDLSEIISRVESLLWR
ncbi:Alpha-ketoglutarate-dependent dioxygenase FTO [Bagarius yarrelli]|uniref:Alpha-ketoglutarate-dependent dioxygenase FTO n=1 Tax=Bagarius yarrelli TaxID=175774 RepID=A0A556VBD5_BAGYA|nr:Alpha-ketoglutarate-dependent dioxygenase FTO [Bagarius yarrelli]